MRYIFNNINEVSMSTTRRWVKRAVYLLALGAAVQLTGCSSAKTYGAVKFTTIPPGAEVVNLKDDANLGMTPVLVTWEGEDGKPEYVTVELTKKGYQNEITSFWVNTRHKSREAAAASPQPVTVELSKRK
jgi:hypothetical protein